VIAYALAGTLNIDLVNEPLGIDRNGQPVYLRDIWPSAKEVQEAIEGALKPELFHEEYGNVYTGNETWNQVDVPTGSLFSWDEKSTYVQEPPFFTSLTSKAPTVEDIKGARVLALLGDSITTDHISPAGAIPADSPAARYLTSHGVERRDFNSFGSRRGNHEVMMRGTFGNIRLKNQLVPGSEGGISVKLPPNGTKLEDGEVMSIYDASMAYQAEETPLIVIAGKEYGTGSSRDWAAKGAILLGVKAVLAESYERIHRSNLIGMGVLPLEFQNGQNAVSLGLTGYETYDIGGISGDLQPHQDVQVIAHRADGSIVTFTMTARIDTPVEIKYYQSGGILHSVLRDMVNEA
jgi:aconitate hydratase